MRMTRRLAALLCRLRREEGFTMIAAVGVMLVTSLLVAAAFTVAEGDVHLSREDTTEKQAYYAALAGVQAYNQKLQENPDYWETCEGPTSSLLEAAGGEHFEVEVMVAHSAPKGTEKCSTTNPFETVVESEGSLANTFRIRSKGYAKTTGYQGSAKREIIATFHVIGFLDYVYYTNFEQEDPHAAGTSESHCLGKYYSEWSKDKEANCQSIEFTNGDSVEGPMHTNDAADVGSGAEFGRAGHSPADTVEINGGIYSPYSENCSQTTSTFNTTSKCFTKGATLLPPESDTSLETYAESEDEFEGLTHLELKGTEIAVTYYKSGTKEKKTLKWPKNGLIYVKAGSGECGSFSPRSTDTSSTEEKEKGCGNVYVSGTYSKSITIAAEHELIINGNFYPTSIAKLGEKPSGTVVAGLIASTYLRVYHPCTSGYGGGNGSGSLTNPWIYSAILSTAHSFIVDNFGCGSELGELHVYGAIAQNYRGPVGAGSSGYIKDYKYDERLATTEPPYYLAPLKAGWKIERETAPSPG